MTVDDRHMRRAIELARGERTHPNPRVGAVVIDASGEITAEAAHTGPGDPHAEARALAMAGDRARGGTLYVTLEPCVHVGRTPPCVDAVIASGLARVVIGASDPDPRVSGRGIETLVAAGVEVETMNSLGARAVDPAYFRHRETGLPMVTLKVAMTLDGSIAARDGTSKWITGDEARRDAHVLRSEMDGIVIGAGTLRTDDPSLDVRLEGYQGHQPRPVVIAGGDELPSGQALWSRDPIVVSSTEIGIPSGELLVVEGTPLPDPRAACIALAGHGLLDLMLEGGPTLAGEWWRAGVVTRGVSYIAGLFGSGSGRQPLGGVFETLGDASVVTITGVRSLGADLRVDYERD